MPGNVVGTRDGYDVIVVGLGGMGSAAAYHLAERGRRVLGLERFIPGHAHGSSHGRSRIIRQAYFEDPAYVPLLMRAYELWPRLEHDAGVSLLEITGGLMMGEATSAVVAGSIRSAREHSIPLEVLDADAIRRRFPAFRPTPETIALWEQRAGVLRPEAAVLAHLERNPSAGLGTVSGPPAPRRPPPPRPAASPATSGWRPPGG